MFIVLDIAYHDYLRFSSEQDARDYIAEQINYAFFDKKDFRLYQATELEI